MKQNTDKTLSDFAILIRLTGFMRPYIGWILLGILLSFATTIANISLMALSGWFIASMAIVGVQGTSMDYYSPAAGIRGFAIVRTSGRYAERIITHEATFKLIAHLRLWFYNKLEPLVPAHVQHLHSGDLLSRIRSDIDTLENFYLRIFSPIIIAIIVTLVVVGFVSLFDPAIALVTLFFLLIAGWFIPLAIYKKARDHGEQINTIGSDLRTTSLDSIQGMSDLLIYRADEQQIDQMNQQGQSLQKHQFGLSKLSGLSQGGILLCANVAMWFVLLLAIPLVNQGLLQPANLAMLALLVLASFEAVIAMPVAFLALPETLAAARRLFAIADIDIGEEQPEKHADTPLPQHFDICFEDVSFHYPDQPHKVLEQFNLTVAQGKKVGIIGHSGSGKSTLINLLLGFWRVQEGRITLGNYPIQSFDPEKLRSYFSVVPQHTHLFNSTIRANLYLANREATDEELIDACKAADIHDFIDTLPEGYDTWLGETGVKVSGGQAKRIAIARALLKPAPILLLDEPGEALDPETEDRVIRNIIQQYSDKTILLITHRETGLEWMDNITQIK